MSVIIGRALPDVRDGLKPVHRRILHTMNQLGLHPNSKFVKSARIVGECFTADTLISTIKGLTPIKDIKIGDVLFTQRGTKKVTELYKMPIRPLLKIVTTSGLENTVTHSQKIKILNDKFEFVWKKADEMRAGDFIVSRIIYPDNLKIIRLSKKFRNRTVYLNEKLGYLLGHFLADGWYEVNKKRKGGRLGFVSSDLEVIENIRSILESEFGYTAKIATKESKKKFKTIYIIRIHSPELSEYIAEQFGLRGVRAYTKSIPTLIMKSPKNVIYHFVSGFIDGDGAIRSSRRLVVLSTISPLMSSQFLLILYQLGIFGRKYIAKISRKPSYIDGHLVKSNYPCNNVEINGESARLLATRLTLKSPHKALEAKKILNGYKIRNWSSMLDMVPFASRYIFSELSRYHLGAGWYKNVSGHKFRMGIKYPGGGKIRYSSDLSDLKLRKDQIHRFGIREKLKTIGSSISSKIEMIFENNIQFLEVKSVTMASPEETYDIEVEGEHEFIANAMLSHNCMGKYHPHGDSAIYDSLVRMAQDFSLRYPLIKGQGNFGSIDGDAASAMRYSEAKLAPIAECMLGDIDKDTVDFRDNYDSSQTEPMVLPTRIPNLLVNGSMGIAVGMATNIPPHNLTEVLDALAHLIDTPDADVKELMQFVKGPDFPTGATIYNEQDITNAYATGRGPVVMRGKAEIVEKKSAKGGSAPGGVFQIIISEIPYQVNKSELIIKIADLVKEKRIDGIRDLRDESDKDGMRIAIDLKQDAFPRKILNQLYKYTELQKSFHFNMLALVDGIQPQTLGLKALLEKFIDHRKEVVTRRSKFELQKAKDRAHILEGLKKALDHIDEVIKIIRASDSKEDAATNLMKKFKFSDKQAAAILEMRLQALAGLERKKVEDELAEKMAIIAYLEDLLKSPKKILGVVKTEFKEIREKYGDERRTKVVKSALREIGEEELIPEENSLFMITKDGYIKRMAPDLLKAQKRGGKGLIGMATKEEDVISHFFLANTHDSILFFTDSGKVFQTKGYEVPESSRQSKGKAIVNFLQVTPSDVITAIVPLPAGRQGFPKDQRIMFLFMTTEHGVIKKIDMDAFAQVRKNGMLAIKLKGTDRLGWVLPTSGEDHISLVTSAGNAIRFKEKDVRPMGRGASGVIGVRLEDDKQRVVGADVIPSGVEKGLYLLVLMENGYGKRTEIKSYKIQKRGGHGIMTAKLTPKTGNLVSAHMTSEEQKEIIAVSRKGQVIRTSIASISILGRATQGVRVMRLDTGDKLASVVVS